MKIKKIILLLSIFCCGIVLISCTKENNTDQQEKKGEMTQKTSEAKIVQKNVIVNGLNLKVPQFSSMEKGKQEKLNEILINQIKQEIEILDSKGSFAYFDYSIEYQDATKISVLFQYDYNKNNMAHPLVSAFTVNIDIANEKVITLSDVIENKKDIVELFRKGKLKNVIKNNHGIENDGGYLESQSDESLLSDMGDHSFYIMDKGYGFVFNTIYASGNYMIYECDKWDNKNSLQTKDGKKTKELIDFQKIEKRTWLVSEWDRDEAYQDFSIVFTKISDEKIEGYFLPNQFIAPDFNVYAKSNKRSGRITGTITNNIADCQLNWKEYGIKGTARIVFKSDDEMEVSIKYTEKTDDEIKDKVITMKPYTLKDMESNRVTFEDKSSSVDLKEWGGKVNFVSRYRTDNKHKVLFLYLTDSNDRVLYDFSQPIPLPSGINIKEFSFMDLNTDGRKDFILILETEARVYFQNEYGGFDCEYSMIKKLNRGKKKYNKNVKSVLSYLSENGYDVSTL